MACDPRISEWGNPSRVVMTPHNAGRTRGTETSKYPQEKRTIVIPRVVVSESGIAQTGPVTAVPGL